MPKRNKGYSFIEMLIYVSLLTAISIVVMRTILLFSQSYRTVGVLRTIDHTALSGMERMTRDIRAASSVVTASSTLGTSPGILTLISSSGIGTTTKFYIQNGTLKVDVNGAYSGPLSESGASISNLTFFVLTGSTTDAVKIDMTVQASSGLVTKSKTYHSTAVLKGK